MSFEFNDDQYSMFDLSGRFSIDGFDQNSSLSTRLSRVGEDLLSLLLSLTLLQLLSECINEWLRGHVKCAYCRTPVLLDLLQSSPSSLTTRSGEQRRRQRTRPSRNPYVVSRRPSTHLASTTIEQEQRTTEDENLS